MSDAHADRLWERRHALLFRCELSTLYHARRARFFDLLDRGAKAVTLVGGSATLWKLTSPDALAWIGLAVTAASALALVAGFAERARRHGELAAGFKGIEAQIRAAGEAPLDAAALAAREADVARLESGEPAAMVALVRLCHAELARAAGQPAVSLPWYQRALCQVWSFGA